MVLGQDPSFAALGVAGFRGLGGPGFGFSLGFRGLGFILGFWV